MQETRRPKFNSGQENPMEKGMAIHSSQQSNAQNSPSWASTVHEPIIPDVQTGFRKDRGTRDHSKSKRVPEKTSKSISVSLTTPTPLTVWVTTNCEKFLNTWKDQNTLPEKSLSGQEATLRTGYGTMDWFQIG